MEIIMFGAVFSVICLALAGFLMYKNHIVLGALAAVASLLVTGTLVLRDVNNLDVRLLVLLPTVIAIAALAWWVSARRFTAMWLFVAMLFVHSWCMKTLFMAY